MPAKSYREKIVDIAESADPAVAQLVQKELLHCEILALMQRESLLQTLTFSGGTALRLCYGNARLSEDLDFVTWKGYYPELLRDFAIKAQQRFSQELGIEIHVSEPKILRAGLGAHNSRDYINIDRWQISFALRPDRPDIPRSKIKVEIATVPAYTRENMPIQSSHPDVFSAPDIQVPVESLTEIMADKLIALPANEKYIRYRDIWDLTWMAEKGIKPDVALITRKITDYRIECFAKKVTNRLNSLSGLIEKGNLAREMAYYLPRETIHATLVGADKEAIMLARVQDLLLTVSQSLE